ncbi:MAG: hypothetical protein RBS08_09165 [Bdellovibrionales bacterium]|nr:hypothetical protein [Bdellovibrionales bacterium]
MRVYHTFFAEFKGPDDKAVIQAVFEDARKGTGQTYDEWWTYQQKVWDQRYGIIVPNQNEPEAETTLLRALVKTGALVEGPQPPRPPAKAGKTPGMSNG